VFSRVLGVSPYQYLIRSHLCHAAGVSPWVFRRAAKADRKIAQDRLKHLA
jgi:hypothetical protein